ncbi:DnaJ domain-containing protein [Idiomarina loihiensis]|uniref:DNA-J related domain-containing protein n=1 Tax=Idiomarina loihiensis TaxID=135577 RepID=UPI00129C50EC|nr:DNA-J related domain-containing protein [Idiomarina loihiensis]MRJ45452.1 DnaJ domain-containing protein [Idiomarina loihiensis]UTW33548.1 DnaJ domain-containing protein [Idiomarina loihiensis]
MNEDIEILTQILAENLDAQHHWTEHELIASLQGPPYEFFDKEALRDPLTLFQTHFLLFHCLYKLRERWREEKKYELFIHTLNIECQPWQRGVSALTEKDALAEYYLDLNQLGSTSGADVESMLDDFWRRMGHSSSRVETSMPVNDAWQIMEVEPPASQTFIKKQYRKLVHKYHPDKGGSVAKMQKIQKAYHRVIEAIKEE